MSILQPNTMFATNMGREAVLRLHSPIHFSLCRRCMAYFSNEEPSPTITVPQPLVKKIQKALIRKEVERIEKMNEKLRPKGPLIIKCKRKAYNHYTGEAFSKFKPELLASHGWKHHKSVGDYFVINGKRPNPALQSGLKFEDFGLHEAITKSLHSMNIKEPTHIQALTIPEMLNNNNVICAAETGSGKTLAYLLPILHMLKINPFDGLDQRPNCPRSVIVVPARELVDQVYYVARRIMDNLHLSVLALSGGHKAKFFEKKEKVDMVVGTPGTLISAMKEGHFDLSAAEHLVLDEGDTLLDDSFATFVSRLFKNIQVGQSASGMLGAAQLAIVGATLPRGLDTVLEDIAPIESFTKVTTKHLHKLMPHVPQKFVRLTPKKQGEYMLKLARELQRKEVPVMVFCNSVKTCYWLSRFLKENGVECMELHKQLDRKERAGRFQRFRRREFNILICSDIASRGLDTTWVQHIVNFDFPRFMSDYIHRVGRVGRVGSEQPGFVTSLVIHNWDVELLWQIETAVRQMEQFHNVNANIKRKLQGRHARKKEIEEAMAGR
ncbi:probable ATP-dependent RNA helicase DDX28 [Lingula anatina]|uniref:RNA helicase n=1 Tax=Lingula anatina TaxID=7574 RepID=A0A1S3JYA8_LINAN|nr:probable ATP-dependent RNA helicase DDX28 [Lingula anatina]|eukprot:XP_013415400.1 probable ATP-dependent RNA helicase DDX28 [Lingula anatina]